MLTRQAKKELLEQKKKLESVLLYGELNDKLRKELKLKLEATMLAIKEMDKLEQDCIDR